MGKKYYAEVQLNIGIDLELEEQEEELTFYEMEDRVKEALEQSSNYSVSFRDSDIYTEECSPMHVERVIRIEGL